MLTLESRLILSQHAISHTRISQRLILALLLTRVLKGISELVTYPNVPVLGTVMGFIYAIVTYLLIAILIWRERDHLSQFYMSRLAVILIIMGKPCLLLFKALGLTPFLSGTQVLTTITLVPVSLVLLWAFRRDNNVALINGPNPRRWVFISLLIGVGLGLFTGYLSILQSGQSGMQISPIMVILLPVIQLANTATYEEPLFRGFLWGVLRQKGWRDGIIWLVQTGLFVLGHIAHAVYFPLSFWVIVPLMGLVFGLIAWRARDIAPAMIAHGLVDGVPQIMAGIW